MALAAKDTTAEMPKRKLSFTVKAKMSSKHQDGILRNEPQSYDVAFG